MTKSKIYLHQATIVKVVRRDKYIAVTIHTLYTPDITINVYHTPRSIRYMREWVELVESCNPGYSWGWDTDSLVGLRIGVDVSDAERPVWCHIRDCYDDSLLPF